MDGIRARSTWGRKRPGAMRLPAGLRARSLALLFLNCQAALTKAQDGSDSPVPQPVPSSSPVVDPASSPSEVDAQARVDSSISEVIADSLIGPLRPELWRPLGFMGLLSEGWDESYAPAPGDAPRQTWINNADGAFYRLFVFSFSFARGLPGNANAYNGSYSLFTPFSRSSVQELRVRAFGQSAYPDQRRQIHVLQPDARTPVRCGTRLVPAGGARRFRWLARCRSQLKPSSRRSRTSDEGRLS